MLLTNGHPTLGRVNNKVQVLPRVEFEPGPNMRAGHFRGESDPQHLCTHNPKYPNIEYPFRGKLTVRLGNPTGTT